MISLFCSVRFHWSDVVPLEGMRDTLKCCQVQHLVSWDPEELWPFLPQRGVWLPAGSHCEAATAWGCPEQELLKASTAVSFSCQCGVHAQNALSSVFCMPINSSLKGPGQWLIESWDQWQWDSGTSAPVSFVPVCCHTMEEWWTSTF